MSASPSNPQRSLRPFAVLGALLVLGLALLAHGWVALMDGSVVINPRNSAPYTATPNVNPVSFYAFVAFTLTGGALASFLAAKLTWKMYFASEVQKAGLVHSLSQPIRPDPSSHRIPSWLFWGAILALVSLIAFSAMNAA
jgi:hypothetical protein